MSKTGVFGCLLLSTQTMGGNFTTKGQQNCNKGIYVLAGNWHFDLYNTLICHRPIQALYRNLAICTRQSSNVGPAGDTRPQIYPHQPRSR